MRNKSIGIHPELHRKFKQSKVIEAYAQKLDLTDNDFLYLLLESYPDPKKKDQRKS